jgi:hypothetical protein
MGASVRRQIVDLREPIGNLRIECRASRSGVRSAPRPPLATQEREAVSPTNTARLALPLFLFACSSPALPAASASASAVASAVEAPGPGPASEVSGDEAVLRDLCPVSTQTTPEGRVAGCATCSLDGPGDAAADASSDLMWIPGAMLTGSFSVPGADERFASFNGPCNPKHGGYAFIAQKDGRWSAIESSFAADQDVCKTVRIAEGRDVVVCSLSRDYSGMGGTAVELLFVLRPNEASPALLSFTHFDGVMTQMPAGKTFLDLQIEGFDVAPGEVVAHVRERTIATSRLAAADPSERGTLWKSIEPGELHALRFVAKDGALVPDPATRAFLERVRPRLPKGG